MQLLAVNFHYFREEKPGKGIFPLTLKEFETQIDLIGQYYDFVSEQDIIDSLYKGKSIPKNYCLLTFDDGLKEQMNVAELLIKKGVPGMFYVSTGTIRNNIVLDVHKLHYVRSIMDEQNLYQNLSSNYDIDQYPFEEKFLKNQYRYDTDLVRKVKYYINFVLSEAERQKVINNWFSTLVKSEKDFALDLYMNIDDLKKLSNHSMLGTHAENHVPLGCLSKKEIKKEIEDSVDFLESYVGKDSIRSISYPYGGLKAVSKEVAEVAEECGLQFGFTMWRGINNFENLENKFLLNRIDTNDAPGGKLKRTNFIPS